MRMTGYHVVNATGKCHVYLEDVGTKSELGTKGTQSETIVLDEQESFGKRNYSDAEVRDVVALKTGVDAKKIEIAAPPPPPKEEEKTEAPAAPKTSAKAEAKS